MKKIIISAVLLATFSACSPDNYKAPASHLTGTVTYNGEPVCLSNCKVAFNLFQDGYEKNGPISLFVNQDGTFSALVFDGSYHIVNIGDAGPWTDDVETVDVVVKGDTEAEIHVTPYYVIRNTTIALSGTEVKALCNVEKVAEGMTARQAFLIVGKTPFLCDQSYSYLARKSLLPPKVGGNGFSLDIGSFVEDCPVLYARIGLQLDGIQECIYSEVIQIK